MLPFLSFDNLKQPEPEKNSNIDDSSPILGQAVIQPSTVTCDPIFELNDGEAPSSLDGTFLGVTWLATARPGI